MTSVSGRQQDSKRYARSNVHKKVGIVSHAQVGTTIAETATGCVVCCHECAYACSVSEEATYAWSSDDVDEAVLKARLLKELSPYFCSPGVVLEAKVSDGALWCGTGALRREQTRRKIGDLKAQYVFL